MTRHLRLFLLALGFLTRITVPSDPDFSALRMAAALGAAPLVGLVVGGLGAATLLAAGSFLPPLPAVVIALIATTALTGALHEDGLADLCDGIGGSAAPDRALEIMRDSQIGTYGALGLGLFVALWASLLAHVPAPLAAGLLVTGHVISRWVMVEVLAHTPYIGGTGGAGAFARDGLPPAALWTARLTAAATLSTGTALWGPGALLGGAIAVAAAVALRRIALSRLGGCSGDVLGATVCLGLVSYGIGVVALWP